MFIYLFIYFLISHPFYTHQCIHVNPNLPIHHTTCIGSLLLHAGFLQLWRAGATLHCGAWASHCRGFSCCGARALGVRVVVSTHNFSSCGSRVLERRLSSCGTRAYLLCGMWDLPRPGLEPVSPALAGGFLTTAPPGKPSILVLIGFS